MPGKRAKILSVADVGDLLTFAKCTRHPLRNCVMVLLSAKAGLRAREIANLTWDMVVDATGQISGLIELADIRLCDRASAAASRFLHEELPEYSIQDEHRLKGIFEYDPANNPQRRSTAARKPDFALLSNGKVIEFLDAKYRDLWETLLPREMLYQLAIYALSKDTGIPRATILYPTLAVEAVDQVMFFKAPTFGHRRAEIALRPVNLLTLEKLVRLRQGTLVARQRQYFARTLIFGSKHPVNSV